MVVGWGGGDKGFYLYIAVFFFRVKICIISVGIVSRDSVFLSVIFVSYIRRSFVFLFLVIWFGFYRCRSCINKLYFFSFSCYILGKNNNRIIVIE